MKIKKGIAVSPGIVVSQAFVLDSEDHPIPKRVIQQEEIKTEISRFSDACQRSIKELEKIKANVTNTIGGEYAPIISAHIKMIEDPKLQEEIKKKIMEELCTAEFAVSEILKKYIKTLLDWEDGFFADRVKDLEDIKKRILEQLLGSKRNEITELEKKVIIVAKDLSPSQTAELDRKKIAAFVTDSGGRTSHTAIVARAIGIPAVVGLEDITFNVSNGETLIVDGNTGTVILNPVQETLKKYNELESLFSKFETKLTKEALEKPTETKDGTKIKILANIEFPEEIQSALKHGAEGIGLYRTEFLYLKTKMHPTEEQHFNSYKNAFQYLKGRELVIRTLDLGADKFEEEFQYNEKNPFLGCRAIRLCLRHIQIFEPQIRAILRAAYMNDAKIMFPMISSVEEIINIKMFIEKITNELKQSKIPINSNIKIGVMIETPAAALSAEIFAEHVNFFSIGTNDLVQYVLAVDRSNERIAALYEPANPAVLHLIKKVIDVGKKYKKEVNLCGEMSGDPLFTILLVGLGLRNFSVSPIMIPEIKKIIRSITIKEANEVAKKVLSLTSVEAIKRLLMNKTALILPEIF